MGAGSFSLWFLPDAPSQALSILSLWLQRVFDDAAAVESRLVSCLQDHPLFVMRGAYQCLRRPAASVQANMCHIIHRS